jgi:hypothetical protein
MALHLFSLHLSLEGEDKGEGVTVNRAYFLSNPTNVKYYQNFNKLVWSSELGVLPPSDASSPYRNKGIIGGL